MRFSFWSTKGGSGCSTIAMGVAIGLVAHDHGRRVLLVDLAGDCAALAAVAPSPDGLTDWLSDASAPLEALARIERPTGLDGLSLLQSGHSPRWTEERADLAMHLIDHDSRDVVIDCGVIGADRPDAVADDMQRLRRRFAMWADRSILCTRACYLSLRRVPGVGIKPTGVVLQRDVNRALDPGEVSASSGAPVIACVDQDDAVARSVDAGILLTRRPRSFGRQLRAVSK